MANQRLSDQGYPGLSSVSDPAVGSVLRLLFDRINSLSGRTGDHPTFRQSPVLRGNRITEVGDPVDDQDAVTLAYAQRAFGAETLRLSLQAGGDTPLALVGLPGLSKVTTRYGTHAERLALVLADLSEGTLCWETDRLALYQVQLVSGSPTWKLVMTALVQRSTVASRPIDLGTNDAGYLYQSNGTAPEEYGVIYRWSGAAWYYHRGLLFKNWGSRPVNVDRGFLMCVTDRGGQTYILGNASVNDAWELLPGVGGPLRGTLNPDQKPALTTADAGFLFYSTDFDRLYQWSGTAWADAQADDRKQVTHFDRTDVPIGYGLCDGGSKTISTAAGGTTAYTAPDLITNNRFLRSASTVGGTGGSDPVSINVPSTTTNGPSGVTTVDNNLDASTVSVAGSSHDHQADPAPFNVDCKPPYHNLRPYVRL